MHICRMSFKFQPRDLGAELMAVCLETLLNETTKSFAFKAQTNEMHGPGAYSTTTTAPPRHQCVYAYTISTANIAFIHYFQPKKILPFVSSFILHRFALNVCKIFFLRFSINVYNGHYPSVVYRLYVRHVTPAA